MIRKLWEWYTQGEWQFKGRGRGTFGFLKNTFLGTYVGMFSSIIEVLIFSIPLFIVAIYTNIEYTGEGSLVGVIFLVVYCIGAIHGIGKAFKRSNNYLKHIPVLQQPTFLHNIKSSLIMINMWVIIGVFAFIGVEQLVGSELSVLAPVLVAFLPTYYAYVGLKPDES